MKNRFQRKHDKILVTYRDAAENVIGRSKKESKPWTGDKTWGKIQEGKEAKLNIEGARLERLEQR